MWKLNNLSHFAINDKSHPVRCGHNFKEFITSRLCRVIDLFSRQHDPSISVSHLLYLGTSPSLLLSGVCLSFQTTPFLKRLWNLLNKMVKLYAALWLLAAATASTEAWKCREDGYAYYGNNIPGKLPHSYQPSQSACQQACAEHDGCSYWTWRRKEKGWAMAPCYLKTSKAGREASSIYISGSKDCKMSEEKG